VEIDPVQGVLRELEGTADPSRLPGMARYGITTERALGVSVPDLRRIARTLRPNHDLALGLWDTTVHEARLLASMIDEPHRVGAAQMETWVGDFDSWDLCDQVCSNLFARTRHAFRKAEQWSRRGPEFEKRAAFALMAATAVHRRDVGDDPFEAFLPLIRASATDERNYVKKAVNWALRQIGKRNARLNRLAISTAEEIRTIDSRSARWIASDALRELTSDAVMNRLDRRRS
jgi:3-methyladenine DNA glycosylase AlkD